MIVVVHILKKYLRRLDIADQPPSTLCIVLQEFINFMGQSFFKLLKMDLSLSFLEADNYLDCLVMSAVANQLHLKLNVFFVCKFTKMLYLYVDVN